MDLFKAELQRFIRGESSRDELERAIVETLRESPDLAERIKAGLVKLSAAGHLESEVAAEISEFANQVIVEQQIAEEDKTQIVDSDQTQFASPVSDGDQTVIHAGDDQTQVASRPENTGISNADERANYTTPTSRTSKTSNTSTTSKWAKPFDENSSSDLTLSVGSIVKDRFHLIEFIGCGGMGDVFKAEDQRRVDAQDVDTLLAIKVLNNNFRDHPDSLRSLQREARKTQNLAHPNIVNVFDFDRDQHHVFMTMELMRGEPLNKVIKANPRGLAHSTVYQFVAEMGAALSYAHRSAVIHSDFKPSNIFLDQNTIKVFDFGIARAAKEGQVDNFDAGDLGALTPTYASPEMLEGEQQADPRDDIYALACITYELLSGKHPFIENGKKVPADQARNKGLEPPLIKGIKRKQWKALKQGLCFDPLKRTASVQQFLTDFLPEQQSSGFVNKWYMWPVAATVLSALAYLPAKSYWEEKQLDDLANNLKNGTDDEILALLVHLEGLPVEEQLSYFNDARVKRSLTQFFIGRMDDQINDDEFADAERSAMRALKIYEDSRRLSDQRELVSKRKAARLNELNIELNRYLNTDLSVFMGLVDKFPTLFASISRVDPKHPMLKDQRVPARMAEVLEWLIEQKDFSKGERVSSIAKRMFPADASILVATEQLTQQQYRFEQATKISELEKQIAAFPTEISLPVLDGYIETVDALNRLAPNSVALTRFKTKASLVISNALEAQFKQGDWFAAEQQFTKYQGLLSDELSNQLEKQLNTGKARYQASLAKQKQTIVNLIEKGDLNKAEKQLSTFDAPAEVKGVIEERLGRAWLTQARLARTKLAWDEAISLVERARLVSSDRAFVTLLDEELVLIKASQMATGPEQQEQIAAQRKTEITQYQKELNSLLRRTADQALLDDVQTVLDKVEQLQPDHPLLSDIPTRLSSRYLSQADTLVQNKELESAEALLQGYNDTFPGNVKVDQRINELQVELTELKTSARYQQIKSEID